MAAEISAAADLDCWLCRRQTTGPVRRSGDPGDFDASSRAEVN